jgi:hypothetical protein
MATLKRIPPEPPTPVYHIVLSYQEASALALLFNRGVSNEVLKECGLSQLASLLLNEGNLYNALDKSPFDRIATLTRKRA